MKKKYYALSWSQKNHTKYQTFIKNFTEIAKVKNLAKAHIRKGYFHLCPCMDFLQTLHINSSLYTNYENVFIELDS